MSRRLHLTCEETSDEKLRITSSARTGGSAMVCSRSVLTEALRILAEYRDTLSPTVAAKQEAKAGEA